MQIRLYLEKLESYNFIKLLNTLINFFYKLKNKINIKYNIELFLYLS